MSDISCEVVLSQILKLNGEEIRTALALTKNYKMVRVPKKSGGYRTLYIPPKPLKEVQRKILKCLFRKIWRMCRIRLYGIYKGTSYVEHAQKHREAKWVFQFDLKDAFPSVNVLSLREIIFKGIEDEMSYFEVFFSAFREEKRKVIDSALYPLYGLMVKEKEDKWFTSWVFPQRKKIVQGLTDLIMELTTFQGILPQGTPTAPFLFYIALTEGGLFTKLNSFFLNMSEQDRYRFRASVYIDNFVVSAQKPIPLKSQKELFKMVEEFGFKVNPRKTRQQGMIYGAPLVTGLRIIKDGNGKGKVVLPKNKVRQIRGLIHRAIFEPDLRPKVNGLIASLKPIYGSRSIIDGECQKPVLPPQIEKPYQKFLQAITKEGTIT